MKTAHTLENFTENVDVKFHEVSVEQILDQLGSDKNGLDSTDAEIRLKKYGYNKLPTVPPPGILTIFLDQLNSPIVYLLIFACAASVFFGDYTEAIAIFLVIVVNAFIGFIMEYQAIRSMEALKNLDEVFVKVFRDGGLTEINADHLVPGDMIFVEGGDIIAADARIMEVSDLEVDESALTGESLPVEKITGTLPVETPQPDRTNMLYKGTAVTKGNGKAVVTGTGSNTELGEIASMVGKAEQEETPLNKRLEGFSRKLIWLVVAIAFPFLVVGLWQQRDMYVMVETAIALAVAAIPEGLPIVATIALARGMLNLAGRQVIIKKLAAVETLGSANIVLTDKTGTITENKLTVYKILLGDGAELVADWREDNKKVILKPENVGLAYADAVSKLTKIATHCNNAVYEAGEKEVGDPLEVSLLKFAAYYHNDTGSAPLKESQRLDEIPFDSDSRIMGTLHAEEKTFYIASKGSVESVLSRCSLIDKQGSLEPLTDANRHKLLEQSISIAAEGMKVLGYAYKSAPKKEDEFLNELVFVGITGFLDPPRADVTDALKECRQAGIKVVMVTGDHFETARTISRQIGLSDDNDEITGLKGVSLAEIDLSDPKKSEKVEKSVFFSRVTPAQKLDLVSFYQKKGYVVGMTGDGINDAPALKKAEIGIAMGQRGTQVAREASDMILKDDAFSSLVTAIRQGRVIYNNIKNFIIYLLSCNLSEIMIVAVAAFSNMILPLLPLQILFLNLVTDVFPALALGMGKGGPDIMKGKPRMLNEPLITRKNWISIIVYSTVLTATVFMIFTYCRIFQNYDAGLSNTVVFFSLSFAQLLHPLSLIPSRSSFFNNTIIKNIHVWLAVVFCIILLFGVYYFPLPKQILSLNQLGQKDWLLVLFAGIFPVILIRILKKLRVIQ